VYTLIVLFVAVGGTTSISTSFNGETKCLEALSKALDFEKDAHVRKVKAFCTKE
jgi:hypothetical protein